MDQAGDIGIEQLGDGSTIVAETDWAFYRPVVVAMQEANVPFALGGGLALSLYGPRIRQSKDVDLYIRGADRDQVVSILAANGFIDYYDQKPYDRGWIYRSIKKDEILDVIWQMANRRAPADDVWLAAGPSVFMHGQTLQVIPLEELIWSKLYILQHDRCDWPDLLNLLYQRSAGINWQRLMYRAEQDMPLLAALLHVFSWLCPGKAAEIPAWVWWQLGVATPPGATLAQETKSACDNHRVQLLDARDWFGPAHKR